MPPITVPQPDNEVKADIETFRSTFSKILDLHAKADHNVAKVDQQAQRDLQNSQALNDAIGRLDSWAKANCGKSYFPSR